MTVHVVEGRTAAVREDRASAREVRHREILQAAARVFHDQGMRGSLQSIADRLGLYKGSLYYHVDSKEELLHEVMDDLLEQLETEADLEVLVDPTVPALERLRSWVAVHVAFVARHRVQARVVVHDMEALPPAVRADLVARRDERRGRLLALLSEVAGPESSGAWSVNPELAAWAVLGMVSWVQEWYDPAGPWSPEELGDRMAALLLAGLAVRPGPDAGGPGSRDAIGSLPAVLTGE